LAWLRLPAAGLYLFLIPVFGAVLATVLLGEKLHPFHALAFALIIAGVLTTEIADRD
jgi:drug/metabolite transporter (DMT)-like permease